MKSVVKKLSWISILVMAGLLALTAAVVASGIDWPWSSEPGTAAQVAAGNQEIGVRYDEGQPGTAHGASQGKAIETSGAGEEIAVAGQTAFSEPQPDEDGYTGPILEVANESQVPSGEHAESTVDWDAMVPENAPDARTPDQPGTDADPNWTGYYYFRVAGSALRPRSSAIDWAPSGEGGCIYQSSGGAATVFNVHLDIPNGARIEYLRIYYYDTSPNTSQAWVTRYNSTGGLEDVLYVTSAGDTGYGTQLSDYAEHIVDSVNYSYVLNFRPNVIGSSMMLCGLRVAYQLP